MSTGVKNHQLAKVEGRKSKFERALARAVVPLQKLRDNLETKPEGLGLHTTYFKVIYEINLHVLVFRVLNLKRNVDNVLPKKF